MLLPRFYCIEFSPRPIFSPHLLVALPPTSHVTSVPRTSVPLAHPLSRPCFNESHLVVLLPTGRNLWLDNWTAWFYHPLPHNLGQSTIMCINECFLNSVNPPDTPFPSQYICWSTKKKKGTSARILWGNITRSAVANVVYSHNVSVTAKIFWLLWVKEKKKTFQDRICSKNQNANGVSNCRFFFFFHSLFCLTLSFKEKNEIKKN